VAKSVVLSDTAIGICTSDIGIPPYQRKGGQWKENSSHKKILFLSSVLNEFPVGAVVIHAEKNSTEQFLMDGQQRREVFNEMLAIRPLLDLLCGKFGNDPADFETQYTEFLQEKFYETDELGGFDPLTPGIKIIVQLRKAYGKRTTQVSTGNKTYPFEKHFINESRINANPYVVNADKSFKGEKLIQGLIDCHNNAVIKAMPLDDDDQKKAYAEAVLDELGITGFIPYGGKGSEATRLQRSKNSVINKLSLNSVNIKEVSSLLHSFYQKVSGCGIGKIVFTADPEEDGTELELPTIFRLINDGGEKMKRVELLASAPRWIGTNAKVDIDASTQPLISSNIAELKSISSVETNKWLVCAALGKSIDELNESTGNKFKQADLLFEPLKKLNPPAIEIGFKMKSLFKNHSVTDKDWLNLYRIDKTDEVWTEISELSDLQTIFQLLGEDKYFKQMRVWGWPIVSKIVRGHTRTSRDTYGMLAALRILFRRNPGVVPGSDWAQKKNFILPARKYFDRFVYHNIGSMVFSPSGADGKLKTELDNMTADNNSKPGVTKEDWKSLIDSLLDDGINVESKDYTKSDEKPKDGDWANWTRLLLAHIYTITDNVCPNPASKYHVDHIIPKDLWQDYCNADPDNTNHCHNFANLMFLDDTANEKKSAKKLSEVWGNAHTRDFISKFGGIEKTEANFQKYSSIDDNTHSNLVTERKTLLKEKFIEMRAKFLTEEESWTV
jgi:hypothetical protein